MFKSLENQAIIKFLLKTQSPLYIKQNTSTLDPTAFDGTYISSYVNGKRIPVIPGTSMKGAFRSYADKFFGGACCDIFAGKENKCIKAINYYENYEKDNKNKKDEKEKSAALPEDAKEKINKIKNEKKKNYSDAKIYYILSCPSCKFFGSQRLKSRIIFDDALAKDGFLIGSRSSTPIDRITGAAKHGGLNTFEYVDYGEFDCRIMLVNFFNWQLKLVCEIFSAIDNGILTFGGYSSKGFGRMKVDEVKIEVRYYNNMKKKARDDYKHTEIYAQKVFSLDEIKNKLEKINLTNINEIEKVELEDEPIL